MEKKFIILLISIFLLLPVRIVTAQIVDLAKQMIRLYGKEGEVEITFTGLRPGEKLYEELLIDESEQQTQYSSIFIAQPTPYDLEQLNEDIDNLLEGEDKLNQLQKIVPEFNHMPNQD